MNQAQRSIVFETLLILALAAFGVGGIGIALIPEYWIDGIVLFMVPGTVLLAAALYVRAGGKKE